MISESKITNSIDNIGNTLKENNLYAAYDDLMLIKKAIIEKDRKIFGLKQTNVNLQDKIDRIGGWYYGNPKR